jgi:hypothetical protein
VHTLSMYPSQRSSGNCLRPAASMHLQLMSQGQPILVSSSSASEVIRRPMTPPFDVRLVAFLWGCVPRGQLCRSARSRSLRLQHSFSEYHISGAVKRLGQWIVYEVLFSQYAVSNEHAGCGSVIQHPSFLFRNVDESEASKPTKIP